MERIKVLNKLTFTCNLVHILCPGASSTVGTVIRHSVFVVCLTSIGSGETLNAVLDCKYGPASCSSIVRAVNNGVVWIQPVTVYRSVPSVLEAANSPPAAIPWNEWS